MASVLALDRVMDILGAHLGVIVELTVVVLQKQIDVLDRLRAHVGELLDLRGDLLDLVVVELEAELLHAVLDRVPSWRTQGNRGDQFISLE